jgi:hypothetical protein
MSAATLDQVLDIAMQLSEEQQEMLLEILQRRQIERRRKEIADGANTALAEYRAGYSAAQPVDEVIAVLHQSLDE